VEVTADAEAVAHSLERLVGEVSGEAGDETQAREVGDGFVDLVEQVGEGGGAAVAVVVVVVVDGLAEEGDFEGTGVGEFADFVDDVLWRAVDFGAAGVWDDAVGAEFVAAAGDADVGLGDVVGGGDGAGEVEELEGVFGGCEGGGAAGGGAHEGGLLLALGSGLLGEVPSPTLPRSTGGGGKAGDDGVVD
jgi:hypothetical protein